MTADQQPIRVEFTIDPEDFRTHALAAAAHDATEMAEGEIKECVRELVRERFAEHTEETVKAEVRAVLEEGFQETSKWGESSGERKTLRDLITGMLTEKKSRGGYNDPKRSILDEVIQEFLKDTWKSEFAKEVKAGQERMRKVIDAHIAEKLKESLKAALKL